MHFNRIVSVAASIVLGAWFMAPGADVQAAPIAFGFEATITEIQGDPAPLNLPFSFAVGQKIDGEYSFQSEQDLIDVFYFRHLRAKRGGVSFTIQGTELEGRTNHGAAGSAEPASAIELYYVPREDEYPGWAGMIGEHHWDQSLVLRGPPGVFSLREELLDIDTWNQMTTLRQLNLRIGHSQLDPSSVFLRAAIGEFFVVPEPSTASLLCALLGAVLARFRFSKLTSASAVIT